MNHKHWLYSIKSVFFALLLSALSASQVYATSVGQNVTLQTTGGSDIALLSGGEFDTLTVNSNGFTFTLSGSQSVSLRDSDAQILKTNIDGLQGSCSGNSEITLSASKGSSITLYIEPFGCSSGGGGGGSYTSGGGGSSNTTTQTTTTTSTTTQATTQTNPPAYLEGAPPPAILLDNITPAPVIPSVIATTFPGLMQIKRGLDVGTTGEDVRALQEALASMPDIYPEGKVSGFYGALTKAAVGKFQMKYGLISSASDPGYGYVGPKTRAKLQEVFGGSGATSMPSQSSAPVLPSGSAVLTRELSLGSEGDDVIQLQAFLASDLGLYPEGKVTGYYGSLTVAAVKRFQAKYGISQLGRVGPQTLAKLNEVMGSGMIPQTPIVGQDDEAAKADLQKQIADMQALVESLTKQLQPAQ
ncbi:MAG: hypothetical protein A3J54_01345 [Candidatus Ryanbacteria bacterium RIFCSPHIGHO2_02_FULL_45_13b]|uniref:Peptidoglycan binding-like domain-containing protein n=1 Tax=Candidatus Ryanbacteria bacterium RIFCSPHIGHO2_02_FULL_45_13b TaxID=1802117 RepID=A0A1G2GAL6_9BACT|nr:MAG: hypothetical protein A3J54_01345 [Candidatus Ryanbacteria bacterium RIFCSPHIGHO2_02_FULL_45_13b]